MFLHPTLYFEASFITDLLVSMKLVHSSYLAFLYVYFIPVVLVQDLSFGSFSQMVAIFFIKYHNLAL